MMNPRRAIAVALILTTWPADSPASQRHVQRFDWADRAAAGTLQYGELTEADPAVRGSRSLRLENNSQEPRSLSWFLIDESDIGAGIYSIFFRFRCRIPQDAARFEIVMIGPPGGVLNSAQSGQLSGSADWQDAMLEYHWTDQMGKLDTVALTLELPPDSQLELTSIDVYHRQPGDAPLRLTAALTWWYSSLTPWVCAALIACLLLSNSAALLLTATIRAQRLSHLLGVGAFAASVVCVVASGAAWWARQPAYVVLTLLIIGAPATIVSALVSRSVIRRWRERNARHEAIGTLAHQL